MKANTGENGSNAVSCDTNDGWIKENIVFDREIWGPGDSGDFGISLIGGRMAFGVGYGGSDHTICGNPVVSKGSGITSQWRGASAMANYASMLTVNRIPADLVMSAQI